MAARVYGLSGKAVVVSTPNDSGEVVDYVLPAATATALGGVKAGANLSVTADGTLSATNTVYTLPPAGISAIGGVKQCPPIDDVPTIPVTDIESAQLAVAAMGTTLSELIQDLRAAGIISS